MEIKNTKDVHGQGIKILLYGTSGSGKTTLIKSLDNPFVLSAEAGLLSIAGHDVDYVEVPDMATMQEAYVHVKNDAKIKTVVLDSISEIAEVVLAAEKASTKDPRAAYGNMADRMMGLVRAFRDLPGRDVVFIAKAEKDKDDAGKMIYQPSMPGQKVGQALPYLFDEVLALRVEKNDEGQTVRAIQTDADPSWTAKDRSGKLDMWEAPDLGAIIKKIRGEK
jgi:phage nucleotide-binding protein